MQDQFNSEAYNSNNITSIESDISDYPNFTRLNIHHKKLFDDFGEKYGHYCDFDFVDLFCWDIDSDVNVAMLNDNLVLRRKDYIEGREYYSIFGESKIDDSLIELLYKTDELDLVPEVVINKINDKSKFIVKENRDSFDYIYEIDDLVNLSGANYKNVRNKLNKFIKEYKNVDDLKTVLSESFDESHLSKLRDVFDSWVENKEADKKDAQREKMAFERLLEYKDQLRYFIVEIWLGSELLAFSVSHVAQSGYVITHFEKVKKVHKYFTTYVIHEVAKMQKKIGCRTVNWEDDLGFPGLRQTKSSYRPKEMLKKYNISMN